MLHKDVPFCVSISSFSSPFLYFRLHRLFLAGVNDPRLSISFSAHPHPVDAARIPKRPKCFKEWRRKAALSLRDLVSTNTGAPSHRYNVNRHHQFKSIFRNSGSLVVSELDIRTAQLCDLTRQHQVALCNHCWWWLVGGNRSTKRLVSAPIPFSCCVSMRPVGASDLWSAVDILSAKKREKKKAGKKFFYPISRLTSPLIPY